MPAPCITTRTSPRDREDRRVERHPLDVRLDVRRRRDRQRPVLRIERGRAREHRQHVPVAADPEQDEVEHRPAVDDRRGPRPAALARARPRSRRRPSPRRSPRSSGTDGCSRRAAAPPSPLLPSALPAWRPGRSSRMSSNGLTLDSGWSRGTKRSSPHQTWTVGHGMSFTCAGAARCAVDADRASSRRSSPSRPGRAPRRRAATRRAIRSPGQRPTRRPHRRRR